MLLETNSKILNGNITEAQLIPFEEQYNSSFTKKKKKQQRQEKGGVAKHHLSLKDISPLTQNQKSAFTAWHQGYNLMLHGLAGTGKSFISLFLALREVCEGNSYYKRIVIVRSAVPTRDIGFLPGTLKEKSKVYEQPYQIICSDLFGRGDSYDLLKEKKIIDFTTTSFIRGNTFYDTILILDEVNNMTFHELDSVITRAGDNCRVIMCGDYRQSDLRPQDKEGLHKFITIIDRMSGFSHVEFGVDDIVRSGLVKEYIIAKHKLGYT